MFVIVLKYLFSCCLFFDKQLTSKRACLPFPIMLHQSFSKFLVVNSTSNTFSFKYVGDNLFDLLKNLYYPVDLCDYSHIGAGWAHSDNKRFAKFSVGNSFNRSCRTCCCHINIVCF